MDLTDQEMLARLMARDGPMLPRGLPHRANGSCRYEDLYEGKPCPWCEAEERRLRQPAGRSAATKE